MRIAALLLGITISACAFATEITGKWNVVAKDPEGHEIKAELSLALDGGKLTGKMSLPEATVELTEVQFKENVLTCNLEYNGMPISLKMTLDGEKLKGSYTTRDGETGPVEAARTAAKAIDKSSPVAGDWKVSTDGPDGNAIKAVLSLKHDDGKWSGQVVVEDYGMTVPLTDIRVDGARFTCNVPTDSGNYALEASVAGEKLEGTSTGPDGTKNKMTGTR